jgi:hypothetical protein
MSRTVRRKNSHLRKFYVSRPHEIDSWDLKRYGCNTAEECVKRQEARYRRDHHPGSFNAPSWYARTWNKVVDRNNKAEIHRCLVQDSWDDHQAYPHIRTANWNWW